VLGRLFIILRYIFVRYPATELFFTNFLVVLSTGNVVGSFGLNFCNLNITCQLDKFPEINGI
jgi:hypothetical protein